MSRRQCGYDRAGCRKCGRRRAMQSASADKNWELSSRTVYLSHTLLTTLQVQSKDLIQRRQEWACHPNPSTSCYVIGLCVLQTALKGPLGHSVCHCKCSLAGI